MYEYEGNHFQVKVLKGYLSIDEFMEKKTKNENQQPKSCRVVTAVYLLNARQEKLLSLVGLGLTIGTPSCQELNNPVMVRPLLVNPAIHL